MRPVAQSDRHDGPRLVDEFVPGIAAVLEDVVVGAEDAIGEPVFADELLSGGTPGHYRGSRAWRRRARHRRCAWVKCPVPYALRSQPQAASPSGPDVIFRLGKWPRTASRGASFPQGASFVGLPPSLLPRQRHARARLPASAREAAPSVMATGPAWRGSLAQRPRYPLRPLEFD
jgi:hypothetical protein